MRQYRTSRLSCALAACLLAGGAGAQNLTLFEETEAEPQQDQPVRALDRAAMQQQNGTPYFTLRSTGRFGDEYQAILVDRAGEPLTLRWREGETVEVPGHAGFTLVGRGAREISLRQPGQEPCIEAPQAGVSCGQGNVAQLRLTMANPLKTNGTPANTPDGDAAVVGVYPEGTVLPADGPQVVINPFSGEPEMVVQLSEEERAARQERQRARAERLQQMLEANRIDPADARPGFRVVRTPFGDREVPIPE